MKYYVKLFIIILGTVFCGTSSFSQGVVITPLQSRPSLPSPTKGTVFSLGITDTLDLPFFDDFVTGMGYPSALRWIDNHVWVNQGYALRPPSYGVATFDHLNPKGAPWHSIDKNRGVFADSLTSQPINLATYFDGVTTKNYTPADSVYLSFFFQRKGLGDAPEPTDSLMLFYKNNAGQWTRVWFATGQGNDAFKQVILPILLPSYLHPSFQFRFVNYTKALGNLNHWHVDYIRIDRQRNRKDTLIEDVTFSDTRKGFLNNWHTMPYDHYLAAGTSINLSKHYAVARNLNPTGVLGVQTRFGIEVRNRYNTLVYQIPFGPISKNILPSQDSAIDYNALAFDTLSGKQPWLDITYKLDPQSPDNTTNRYNAPGDNNRLIIRQSFMPWYAYDDGTAEGGFGLDYAFLGNVRGQLAIRFDNEKRDTLKGVAIYFNRSESDVSSRPFYLRIWKAISLPVGSPDNKDQLMYEYYVNQPPYTDSINHFTYFFFDTSLVLPQGTYYVGWRQNAPFILNVGYDNNFRFENRETRNPFIYYNLLGTWESMPPEVKGAPMIRPLIGAHTEFPMRVKKPARTAFTLYPNPAQDQVYLKAERPIQWVSIADMSGRTLWNGKPTENTINTQGLKSGNYLVKIQTIDGAQSHQILIISR